MDGISTDDPAVRYHIGVLGVVAAVVCAATAARCYLVCRTPVAGIAGEAMWARACKFVGTYQLMFVAVIVVVLAIAGALVTNLDRLVEAIKVVIDYPNVVLADLHAFEPTAGLCATVAATAKNSTAAYVVPDFEEIDNVADMLWLGIGLWAGAVGLYVVVNSVGRTRCFAAVNKSCTCIGSAAGACMWACTLALVIALIGARTAVVIGCDYVEVPEEARYLFDSSATNNHPFLETVITSLQQCNAPAALLEHLRPGALAAQLDTMHDVCDGVETQLMALVVVGTLTFPAAVLTAYLRQRYKQDV